MYGVPMGKVWRRIARPRAATPAAPETAPDVAFFRLKTARDRWLTAGAHGLDMDGEVPVFLCVIEAAPQCSFLIAGDARGLTAEGDGFAGPAISARLRRVADGRVELRHPLAPVRYLGVVFTAPAPRVERVIFDRTGHPVLDRFEPYLADATALSPAARALAAELARAVRAPIGADRVMALLQGGRLRLSVAEAVLRLLPGDEMRNLAARLMGNPDDLALLRRAMPADPWVNGTLPALLEWCARGRPATRRAVSDAADQQASLLQSGYLRPQLGLAVTASARRFVSPRRLAAVLATARNEGPYLLDWIAHHRAVGFDHAVIYSNDNDDGSNELLGLLADQGVITWVRNELAPGARAQWKAYGHAFKMLPDLLDYRWTMVLDLDEYFGCDPAMFASVAEFIGWQEHQAVDAVALRWLHFCAGPRDVWHDSPSTLRFTRREPEISPLFKSLVRFSMFWDSHCHFPYPTMGGEFIFRLEDGSVCHHMGVVRHEKMPADPRTADHAWVAHHVFRSAGEALMKVARGDATWAAGREADPERTDTIVRRFVAMAARTDLVRDDRTLLCAPRLEDERSRLLALPGIAVCDAAIKRRFGDRLHDVCRDFRARDIPEQHTAYRALQRMLTDAAAEPVRSSGSGL